MKHIMLDLETLDFGLNALVLAIGAVEFDPASERIGPSFYASLVDDMKGQQARGRTISGSTVRWWMQQSEQALSLFALTPENAVLETPQALASFDTFVLAQRDGEEGPAIWGNGSDFDNVVLTNLYLAYGRSPPWHFRQHRCYRTVKSLRPDIELAREGTHHNVLDDAMTQAKHLQRIMGVLVLNQSQAAPPAARESADQ